MLKKYYYEVVCTYAYNDWLYYVYFETDKPIQRTLPAFISQTLREYFLQPAKITRISAAQYLYRKYKKSDFHLGQRFDWEKGIEK